MNKDFAKLASGAYGQKEIEGYDIDKELSNRNRTVYVDKDTGKAIVSFRGTDLSGTSRWGDLGTDALIAIGLGKHSDRMKNAKKATEQVIKKYGKGNVSLTGHSLGGTQALHVNRSLDVPTEVYNPGLGFGDVRDSLKNKSIKNKATIHTTGYDPISILSPFISKARTVFRIGKKKTDPHSLKNFF